MNPIDVAELERLLEAATKGVWEAFDNRGVNDAVWIGTARWHSHAETRRGSDDVPDRVVQDAALIVAAVNALPAFLATLKRQREALENIADPLAHIHREAVRQGRRLSGQAYAISNDPEFIKGIARAALDDGRAGS